jgi:hypothetical protein
LIDVLDCSSSNRLLRVGIRQSPKLEVRALPGRKRSKDAAMRTSNVAFLFKQRDISSHGDA